MALINSFKLTLTVMSAKDLLNEVADLVQKWIGEGDADSFREALDNDDAKIVNQVLDKTVAELTGESVSDALYHLVKKYGNQSLCNAVLDEPFDFKKIMVINQHYDELKTAMGGTHAT